MKLQGEVKRVFVFTEGDPSVGISGQEAEVLPRGDYLVNLDDIDEADREQVMETFRAKIKDAFEYIWDDRVTVRFDHEVED